MCVGGGGRRIKRCQNRDKFSELPLFYIFVCNFFVFIWRSQSFEEDLLHYYYRKAKPELSCGGTGLLHSTMTGCWAPGLRFLSLVGANFSVHFVSLYIATFPLHCLILSQFVSMLYNFIAHPQISACLGRTSSRTG